MKSKSTWAQLLNSDASSKQTLPSKKSNTVDIQYNNNIDDDEKHVVHSKVPIEILRETTPGSDEEMILTNGKTTKHYTYINNKKVLIIPEAKGAFLLNKLMGSQKIIFFHLIAQYLDSISALKFLECGKIYSNIFKTSELENSELCRFWKSLFFRDFPDRNHYGLRMKRRSKISKADQLKKHQEKQRSYIFWQEKYQFYKTKDKQSMTNIKYHNDQLSYYPPAVLGETNDEMIIVTKHKCVKWQLLDKINFIWSNWYDMDEKDHDELYAISANTGRKYHIGIKKKRGWKRNAPVESDGYGCWGYNIDCLMKNIQISSKCYVAAYLFHIGYTPRKYYIKSIAPTPSNIINSNKMKSKYFELLESQVGWNKSDKSFCRLRKYKNTKENVSGVILNRILDIKELTETMNRFKKHRKQLQVLVYEMVFNQQHPKVNVVVDYFGEDVIE